MRKVIIVNDDRETSSSLEAFLKTLSGVIITGIYLSLTDAEPFLDSSACDILFAPVSAAMMLIASGKRLPLLVCTSEEKQHLPEKANKNIFAWLQAPFTKERVSSLIQNSEYYMQHQANSANEKKGYVFIKSDYKLIKVNLADILYLSGLRDYTQVFLRGKNSPLTTLQNLKDFEEKLPSDEFIRVHRSYIVSVSQIDSISRNEISIGAHIIPIGNAYRPVLDAFIEKNS